MCKHDADKNEQFFLENRVWFFCNSIFFVTFTLHTWMLVVVGCCCSVSFLIDLYIYLECNSPVVKTCWIDRFSRLIIILSCVVVIVSINVLLTLLVLCICVGILLYAYGEKYVELSCSWKIMIDNDGGDCCMNINMRQFDVLSRINSWNKIYNDYIS